MTASRTAAIATMRALLISTATAAAPALSAEQRQRVHEALAARAPGGCVFCGDATGVRCCEFGADR